MRDPAARIDLRAWAACVACPDGRDCPDCAGRRRCERHWRHLLQADGRQVFLQCPWCLYRWWHDTGFGAGRRPLGTTDVTGLSDLDADGRAA
jgi:hypothetical protein